ncbi:fungal-specific transcription factor domain-containing protein [Mycena galopus ATCC 62051]|nr:fungal-specific transcription factor domain-containing protein [Mycena galopus ATCC 62051]
MAPEENPVEGSNGPPTGIPPVAKKRRLRGACDICRRQKIRCDSGKMPGNRCSNCVSFNSECTHNMSQSKASQATVTQLKVSHPKEERGPRRKRNNMQPGPGSETSVRALETARTTVDGLLRQTYTAPQDREALLELLLEISRYARSLEQELETCRQSQSPLSGSSTAVSPESDYQEAHEEAGIVVEIQKLPEHLKRITMDAANHRFFGKNSSIMFVKAAMEARMGSIPTATVPPRLTRAMFWTPLPWEASPDPVATLIFPPADLLRDLVDIYFTQINIFWFILHRPTFEKSIADGLHHRNATFGAIVLVVCALASKNSPDRRVLLPSEQGELSAGWEWFRQVRRPFSGRAVKTASVYELQLCCLYLAFQQTGSDQESCWLMCGIGLLYAQDIGAHRDPPPGTPFTIEHELLKRSCFYLSLSDSVSSACFGRPRVALPTDCDLARPIACDDEYWEHPDPATAFKQPAGKPALSEFFNVYISLINIFTFSWRTSGPPQDYTGTRPLELETVVELDSRLDKWVSSMPEHLLWNPYQENDIFFEQSVALYASYYHLQILIHRPFLHASVNRVSTARSLAICTNAARSCATIADVKSRRGIPPNYHMVKSAFESAIVLLLTVSGGTRSGLVLDIERELADVYKCMALLRRAEIRHQNAGRFHDCLCEILHASHFPLPPTSEPDIISTKLSYDTSYERKHPMEIMNPGAESWADDLRSMPMAVEDLGSLPIYESLDSLEKSIASSDFGPLPSYDFSISPHISNTMDPDNYLSHWMPYLSSVDGVAQAMQGINGPS